jgi:hypothetical protein
MLVSTHWLSEIFPLPEFQITEKPIFRHHIKEGDSYSVGSLRKKQSQSRGHPRHAKTVVKASDTRLSQGKATGRYAVKIVAGHVARMRETRKAYKLLVG